MALGKVLARGQVTVPREIRRAVGLKPGDLVAFQATAPGTIEMRVLPRMTLAEMFERYRIEGPIDEAADRDVWEAEAAKDTMRELDA